MRFLLKKLLRDIRFSVGQYVAITLVILLGVAFYVGMMSASSGVRQNVEAFYASQNLADLWVTVSGSDDSTLAQIKALPDVAAADGRTLLAGTSGTHDLVIHTVPADPTVNIPSMDSGHLPQSPDECIVDRDYAAANNLHVGSPLSVTINGTAYNLTLSGIFNSPEYLYLAKDITAQPNHLTYGALLVSPDLIPDLPTNEIIVKAAPGADLTALKSQITQITQPAVTSTGTSANTGDSTGTSTSTSTATSIILDRTQLFSWVQLNTDITQFGQLGSVFPIIFFLVAAAIIFISMSKNVETQRGQIGNMKALGIRNSLITFHFLSYTLLTCLVGCALGAVVGIFVVMPLIQSIFTSLYTMPPLHAVGFAANIAISTALAFAFGILATLISVRRPLRESPALAMRPQLPKKTRPILLERSARLWTRLSFGRKIVLRNLFLNKGRALLSSVGIIGCVGLLLASFAFLDCMNNLLGSKFFEMNRYDLSVTLKAPVAANDPFPLINTSANGQKISVAWPTSSVPATFTSSKSSGGEDIANPNTYPNAATSAISTNLTALDAACDAIALYDPSGQLISIPTDGVIIPQLFAQKYHLSVGDQLTLALTSVSGTPQTVTVNISAIARQYLEQDIYTSFAYLNTLGVSLPVMTFYLDIAPSTGALDTTGTTSTPTTTAAAAPAAPAPVPATDPAALAAALQSDPSVSQALTQDDLANAWSSEMSLMNSLIFIMIAVSAALALTVVYNISAINILERRRDIATLKVLGYHRKEVNRLVFQENLLITAFGALLGIPAGIGILALLLKAVVSDTMVVPMVVSPLSFIYAIALGFAFTILANQLLRPKIKKIDMVESLKSIE